MNQNEIVKYHNNMSELPLRKFNATELNILMAICSKCREQGNHTVRITFNEMRRITQYTSNSNRNLAEDIIKTNDKLLSLRMKLYSSNDDAKTTVQFVLFNRFVTDEQAQVLEVKVNEDFAFILNHLGSNFTKFELEEFVSLKSAYAKSCYRQLKRFRMTGFWRVSMEDFRRLMDIPDSYKMSNINTFVLYPIKNELSSIFNNLKIEKIYAKKRGRPVDALVFWFDKEKISETTEKDKLHSGHICPECGYPLIEKKINGNYCWCHEDGWKKESKCNRIFNSVAEIKGYDEVPERTEPPIFQTDIDNEKYRHMKSIINKHLKK